MTNGTGHQPQIKLPYVMFGPEDPENGQNTQLSPLSDFCLKFYSFMTLQQMNIVCLAA